MDWYTVEGGVEYVFVSWCGHVVPHQLPCFVTEVFVKKRLFTMTACFSRTWRSSSKEAAFSSCSRAPPSGVNRPAAFGISHQVISSRGGERTRVRNSLCGHFCVPAGVRRVCSIVGLLQQSKMSLTAPPLSSSSAFPGLLHLSEYPGRAPRVQRGHRHAVLHFHLHQHADQQDEGRLVLQAAERRDSGLGE